MRPLDVIPAQAGTQGARIRRTLWVPAYAGMTLRVTLDSRLRGNDGVVA
jgi:hypothetical protein